jgi:pantothenate kinase
MKRSADEDPWNELEDIFVETWMLRVEKKVAMDNVFRRKIATGRSAEEARHQVEHNDGRNADEILSKSLRPDFLVDASAAHLIAAEQQQPS